VPRTLSAVSFSPRFDIDSLTPRRLTSEKPITLEIAASRSMPSRGFFAGGCCCSAS
jgi:hypothetical protein